MAGLYCTVFGSNNKEREEEEKEDDNNRLPLRSCCCVVEVPSQASRSRKLALHELKRSSNNFLGPLPTYRYKDKRKAAATAIDPIHRLNKERFFIIFVPSVFDIFWNDLRHSKRQNLAFSSRCQGER